MKARLLPILAVGVGLVVAGPALRAHHSFAMEFDNTLPVTLAGTITAVEWANPHVRVYLDVRDDAGRVTNWELAMPSVNSLLRRGWTRDLLVPGDAATVEAFRARDGSSLASVWLVVLSNGRKLPAGLPLDAGPAQ